MGPIQSGVNNAITGAVIAQGMKDVHDTKVTTDIGKVTVDKGFTEDWGKLTLEQQGRLARYAQNKGLDKIDANTAAGYKGYESMMKKQHDRYLKHKQQQMDNLKKQPMQSFSSEKAQTAMNNAQEQQFAKRELVNNLMKGRVD